MELKQVLEKRTDIPVRFGEKSDREKALWTEDYKTDDVVYKEFAPKYSYEGDAPMPPDPGMETAEVKPRNLPPHVEKELEHKVLSFNVILRWEDPNLRDLTIQRARELIPGDANTR
jgi:hypothetical protein